MSPPFTKALHQSQSLHLFRALLRETTYLPDPAARLEISKQIKHRFRNGLSKRIRFLQDAESTDSNIQHAAQTLLQSRLKTARQGLTLLQNANNGGLLALSRVLYITYGRTGSRRYDLVHPLLDPESEFNSSNEAPQKQEFKPIKRIRGRPEDHPYYNYDIREPVFAQPSPVPKKLTTLQLCISPQFSALNTLVESQSKASFPSYGARFKWMRIRSVLKFPRFDIWDRPQPVRKVRNLATRWYATFLDKLLVPLPAEEWWLLRDLATGRKEWEGLKERRKRCKEWSKVPEVLKEGELQAMLHLTETDEGYKYTKCIGVGRGEYKVAKSVKYVNVEGWLADRACVQDVVDGVLEEELGLRTAYQTRGNFPNKPHRLSARYMRRMWARVFSYCPLLEKGENPGEWKVTWGYQMLQNRPETGDPTPLLEMVLPGERLESAKSKI